MAGKIRLGPECKTVYNYSPAIRPVIERPVQTPPSRPAFELDHLFCANPRCELHVRAGDPGVRGVGNWARLPDGRWVGRHVYHGILLCDVCGHADSDFRPTVGLVWRAI